MNEEKIEKNRRDEIQLVSRMIELYCRKKHKNLYNTTVCDDCKKLLEYACSRSERCPFMENKTFCSNCKVHCYSPIMRKKIKEVMRYSASRMLLYHPIMCIRHAVVSLKGKFKRGSKMRKR